MNVKPPLLYADHHATTPLLPEVLDAMLPWLSGLAANPSSVHAPGRAARQAIEETRAEVARAVGAKTAEIIFTSGGSESDNLGVRGAAHAVHAEKPSRRGVVFSAAEHSAVREAARALTIEGLTAVEIPVGAEGLPRPEVLDAALDESVALVSLVLANNETGALNDDVPAVARRAHERGILVHTDAVQAVGKIPVDVGDLGVDLLSLTGHKFGGPKGAGALVVKTGVKLHPLSAGGPQERGRRAGTENVPAIVGLGTAIRLAAARVVEEGRRIAALRDRFEAGLRERCPTVRFNGGARRLPTVSSVVFPGIEGEMLLIALDMEGIAISAGSACSSGTSSPSRVLLACGLPVSDVRSTLRFSFGRTTTEGDIDRLLETVPRLVQQAVQVSSGLSA